MVVEKPLQIAVVGFSKPLVSPTRKFTITLAISLNEDFD
jgi:hypothetical protein